MRALWFAAFVAMSAPVQISASDTCYDPCLVQVGGVEAAIDVTAAGYEASLGGTVDWSLYIDGYDAAHNYTIIVWETGMAVYRELESRMDHQSLAFHVEEEGANLPPYCTPWLIVKIYDLDHRPPVEVEVIPECIIPPL